MNLFALRLGVLLIAGPLVAFPDDLEDAYQSLKEAESKKDAAQVKKRAAEACALARQEIARPAPQGAEEKGLWTKRVGFARDVETYAEYVVFTTAAQAPPATAVDLFDTLEELNPKSKYLAEGYGHYFQALHQTGGASKIPAIAKKAIANFPDSVHLLLVLMEGSRQQPAAASAYAERLLAALARSKRPEGVAQADWDRQQSAARTRAQLISGIGHSEKKEWFQADTDLRAALPGLKGDEQNLAAALFHLGLVNYQIGRLTLSRARVLEAARFSDQAAQLKSPLAEQAWRNAGIMRNEAAKMR